MKRGGGDGSGRGKAIGWRETRLSKELEILVKTDTIPASRSWRISPREHRDTGLVELHDRDKGILKFSRTHERHRCLQTCPRVDVEELFKTIVPQQRRATWCPEAALGGGKR